MPTEDHGKCECIKNSVYEESNCQVWLDVISICGPEIHLENDDLQESVFEKHLSIGGAFPNPTIGARGSCKHLISLLTHDSPRSFDRICTYLQSYARAK
ncbi:hypothetical protein F2P81_018661 [Scophthalmus maximus]|uniref:Uncharacterized protein n=1 Tax=Scophthalmus maximus TaxID=52904 RepID=A0A6A4S2X0_SCOMX|nr:hypothetical protein F2P81_018661 [Scophthalmus maximus]